MGRKKKVYNSFSDYSKTMQTLCLKLRHLNEHDRYAMLSHHFCSTSRYSKKKRRTDKMSSKFALSKELLSIIEFNENLSNKMFEDPLSTLINLLKVGYDSNRNRFFSKKLEEAESIIGVWELCPSLTDTIKAQAKLLANCYNQLIKDNVKKKTNFDFKKSKNVTFSPKQDLFNELANEVGQHSTYTFRDMVIEKDKKLYKIIKNENRNGRSLELIIYACSRLLFVYKNKSLNIIPNHIHRVIKDYCTLTDKTYTDSTIKQMRCDIRKICYTVALYAFSEQYSFRTVESTYDIFKKIGEQSKLIVVNILDNELKRPTVIDFLVNNFKYNPSLKWFKNDYNLLQNGRFYYALLYEHLLI